jgi:hypothetical protein
VRNCCNENLVIANPNHSVALLLRGRDNAAGPENMLTTEFFLKRDGRENINYLKIVAPSGPRGLKLAWTINRKVRISNRLSSFESC